MDDEWFDRVSKVKARCSFTYEVKRLAIKTADGVLSAFDVTHQAPKVAEGISSQLDDALCESVVVADEAGEDSGQTVASAVQHHGSGDSFHRHLGAAAMSNVANEEHSECVIDLTVPAPP